MTTQLLENRYRILQELGQGGFGKTFLAEDIHMPSNRRCVIKQLKPVTNDPAVYQVVKERFQREAVILEHLGEGNRQIPSLFAYFTAAGQFYLVQEWIEGETLTQRFDKNQGPLSSAEVSQLLIGLLPVLDFIHDQGIVHRDIKPDNIILRKGDQQPILIDFGAVKETMGTIMNMAGQTTSSIVIGTPGFMASEQSIGRPVFSSDLYSLGLTAIYLLTGKYPNEFPSDPATGKLLWQDGISHLDFNLAAVLNQSIGTYPRDRFSNANAMLRALQNSMANNSPPVPETAVPDTYHQARPTIPMSTPPTVAVGKQNTDESVYRGSVSAYAVENDKGGMADWQKTILTGGIIGAFIFGGMVLNNHFNGSTTDHSPPLQSEPPVILSEPDSEPEIIPDPVFVDETTAYGKYENSVQVISCDTAIDEYGRYNDWGYWESDRTVCGVIARSGYWVYSYPEWYVWSNQVSSWDVAQEYLSEITSAYGKYANLVQILSCEADWESQGDYNDFGYWDDGSLVCGVEPRTGYWVYVYPDWYVWETEVGS